MINTTITREVIGYRKSGAPIYLIAGAAPTLEEQRDELVKSAQAIVDGAKAAGRDLSGEEVTLVKGKIAEAKGLNAKIEIEADAKAAIAELGGMAPGANGSKSRRVGADKDDNDAPAKSLGAHFVKSGAYDQLVAVKGHRGATVASTEYKASTDSQFTGGPTGIYGDVLTEVDRTVVPAVRRRLTVADLLGKGTISGQAITYFVEGALEGNFGFVAESGTKPQMHFVDPTVVTDALKEIAGWIRVHDNMIEDLDFVVTEINQRLLYQLGLFEEDALLNGAGTGSTLLGILNRSGIQTETAADNTDNADAIFRALTKVSTGSGMDADAIVINPLDYQDLRLSKDANGQYFGGGFFSGPYGNGAVVIEPPLWGRTTVVTPAVAAGTVLVGAFAQAATLYRKGGVRVESTNSNQDDFIKDLVTIRAKERVALAVRKPAGFVEVTLSAADPA